MSPSSICLSRTAACQAHTSLRRQLWRSYRTMSPTFIRYGFILCQNYIATSLSHAQNPRLAYQDAALAPPSHQDQTSPSFTNLFHMLPLLPNFFPSEVRRLISDFKIEESTGLSYFYSYDAFTHLKTTRHSSRYLLHHYGSSLWLATGMGPESWLQTDIFPGLLLATLTGIQAGHTTLCVQGIFGSGKTYSASLLLVVLSSILNVNCVLTAEPNLPLATAIEIIDTLLQDASTNIRSHYARCLANQVKSSSPLDCTPEDRSQLLRHDSTLRCLLITQGSLLRDLCREHPAFQSFLTSCSIAINDEAQQGGQAGSTILASFLDRRCLQLLIGDKEQTPLRHWGRTHKGSPPHETRHEVHRLSQQPFSLFALGICRQTRQGSPPTRPVFYSLTRLSGCPLPPLPLTLPHLPLSSKPRHRAPSRRRYGHLRRDAKPHSPSIPPLPGWSLLHASRHTSPTPPPTRWRRPSALRPLRRHSHGSTGWTHTSWHA